MPCVFISGINTDSGKTVVTGLLARHLAKQGKRVITCKIVQTGCQGISSDILVHRSIMGIRPLEIDKDGSTCPYIFKHPASPYLSARLEGKTIDISQIQSMVDELQNHYDWVLLEGAGGLLVPLTETVTSMDFVRSQGYPIILVTDPKLGSINHSFLSLEHIKQIGCNLCACVYNTFPIDDELIAEDSFSVIEKHCVNLFPNAQVYRVPEINMSDIPDVDFSGIITALQHI